MQGDAGPHTGFAMPGMLSYTAHQLHAYTAQGKTQSSLRLVADGAASCSLAVCLQKTESSEARLAARKRGSSGITHARGQGPHSARLMIQG